MANVSDQMGRSHSYLQQYISRRVPKALKEEDRLILAEIIQVDEQLLRDKVSSRKIEVARQAKLQNDINNRDMEDAIEDILDTLSGAGSIQYVGIDTGKVTSMIMDRYLKYQSRKMRS